MRHPMILKREGAALVVVDVQQRLLPAIHQSEYVVARCRILSAAFELLGLPVIVTEQYPKGLGPTADELAATFPKDTPVIEKNTFSCMGEQAFRDKLNELDVESLLVCGIEAHVCVLQTALDALHFGYSVHVAADAVSSRMPESKSAGLEKMRSAGVAVSATEIAIFELLEKAGTDEFRKVSKLIK